MQFGTSNDSFSCVRLFPDADEEKQNESEERRKGKAMSVLEWNCFILLCKVLQMGFRLP